MEEITALQKIEDLVSTDFCDGISACNFDDVEKQTMRDIIIEVYKISHKKHRSNRNTQ